MTVDDAKAGAAPQRSYKYYDLVMAAFVAILLCSNLIGPAKAAQLTLPVIGPVTFGAGVLFFPISYIFGDVLTEVYGYFARPQGDLGRFRRADLRRDHVRRGRGAAAGAGLAEPEGL